MQKYHKSCSLMCNNIDAIKKEVHQLYQVKVQSNGKYRVFAQVSQNLCWEHKNLTVLLATTGTNPCMWRKTCKNGFISPGELSAQVSQLVFSDRLTVLRLLTTVWCKISIITDLRELSAKVSQIVFWAHLTVLRLITSV